MAPEEPAGFWLETHQPQQTVPLPGCRLHPPVTWRPQLPLRFHTWVARARPAENPGRRDPQRGGGPQGGGGAGAWLMPRPACGPRGPALSVSLTPFALMAHGHERKPVGKPGALSRACPAGPLPLAPGLRQGLRPRAGPGPRESYKVTGSLS